MSTAYDALADEYDSRWQAYVAATVRETLHDLVLRPGDRLLDAGCGTGVLLRHVTEGAGRVKGIGVDLSPRMLAVARDRAGAALPLVRADTAFLPFCTSAFDIVVSLSSLHYWPDPRQALSELSRVARSSGRLVITDWCLDFPTVRLSDLYMRWTGKAYRRAYSSRELRTLLEELGWAVSIRRYRAGRWWGMMTARATRERESESARITR